LNLPESKGITLASLSIPANWGCRVCSIASTVILEEAKMPKLKTKSSVKKRFSLTASGKVRANQANKQHGMIKRTNKQIRNQRGTTILADQDARIVKKFMPYG
jgi:large subunit ribosomal protein L35